MFFMLVGLAFSFKVALLLWAIWYLSLFLLAAGGFKSKYNYDLQPAKPTKAPIWDINRKRR